jgi:zinc D-Ala-D-Ala carboxypeptidase
MEDISDHISYTEATKSSTAIRHGIDNTPDRRTLERMKLLALKVFEPVRKHFGIAIAITSFFRCSALNLIVGGSKTSQHVTGEAMDLDGDVYGLISNTDIFHYIKDNMEVDQLIAEFKDKDHPAWIHVSFKKENNRNQILISLKENGTVVYKPYSEGLFKEIYG